MSKPIDDPRLTAYALGELPDRERHDIEALLRDSAEAREWVEEVRDTSDELRHALQSTAATYGPAAADRSGGSANFAAPALGGTFAGASLRHWLHIVRLPLAVAASLTLTVLVAYPLMTPQLSRSRGIASRDRVASSQREQERSEYKEEGTVLGKKLTAGVGKDEHAADSSSGASTIIDDTPSALDIVDFQISDPGRATVNLTGTNWTGGTSQSPPPAASNQVSSGGGRPARMFVLPPASYSTTTAPDMVHKLRSPATSTGASGDHLASGVSGDSDSGGNGPSGSQEGEKVAMKVVLGSGMVSINGGQFRSLYDPTSSSPEYALGLDSFPYDANTGGTTDTVAPQVLFGRSWVFTSSMDAAPGGQNVDGPADFRAYKNIAYGYEAPSVGDPFSGGNWLIGGNLDLGMPMQLASHDRDTAAVEPPSAEAYAPVVENPFLLVEHQPLSTFSIDVDTASYTNVRRFLNEGQLPPPGAVRIEEMINYFTYSYPQPTDGHPFATTIEVAECPWAPNHRLARIGVQGEIVAPRERPAANLVFLVDVSGSMSSPNKLPLVKKSLAMLLDELAPRDRVAVVTYAGEAGVALPSTPLSNPNAIVTAVDALQSGGSTNGASGITMAYEQAEANFIEGGINRVIIATDGDFNVGVTSQGDLLKLIEDKAKSGVFLSVLGYGMGNLKDATLELLADKGNGHYAYIDSIDEAQHVLVEQMMGTLMTIAKDVKIQVEFNPAKVGAYRLVGYENRMLQAKDFNDDTKDAGEIGSGHSVTALYEIVPAGMTPSTPGVDPLKYQKPRSNSKAVVATQDAGGEGEVVDGARVVDSVEDPGIADAGGQAGEPSAAGEIMAVGSATEVDDNAAPQVGEGLEPADAAVLNELLTVKLRYKRPDGDVSTLIEVPVTDDGLTLDESSDDFAFAAAVASFGMLLRDSAHAEGLTFDAVVELASTALGADESGERAEFTSLVTMARDLRAANQPQ